jgi:hypothetical protein
MEEQVIELFGMKLKIVEDDGSKCDGCALESLDVCHPQACATTKGEYNRHFVRIEGYADKARK